MVRSKKTEFMRIPRRGHKEVRFEERVIILRDQDYLHNGHTKLTGGFSFADHVANVNRRIFFWPGTDDGPIVNGVNHFKRYKKEHPAIIRVALRSLLQANPLATPYFCKFNSGSPRTVNGRKSPRGPDTFLPSDAFDASPSKAVEVTFCTQIIIPRDTEVGHRPTGPWKQLL